MEFSQQDDINIFRKIKDWQNGPPVELVVGEKGVVARLVQGCLDLFSSLLRQIPESALVTRKDGKTLRRYFATLTLWADGHGALEGKLDLLFEKATALQYPTMATLNSLCGVLVNRLSKLTFGSSNEARLALLKNTNTDALYEQTKFILAGLDDVATDSSSDSNSSADEAVSSKIKSVIKEVKTYVECLVDLSSALECPAVDPDHAEDESRGPRLEKRNAHEYYSDLIVAKFPNASFDLVECLGKANWDRYQRLQLERLNNSTGRTAHSDAISVRSAVLKSHPSDSEFRDSGLGTSIPTQSTTYAETIISFVSNVSSGNRINVPPLPVEGRSGQSFECVACGRYIKATTNREWRNHLFSDALPYTCFHLGCSFNTAAFSTRKQWSDHLELDHHFGPDWADRQCPLCLKSTGAGKNVTLIHFARHMEEIALTVLPRSLDSEASSEAASDTDSEINSTAPSPRAVPDNLKRYVISEPAVPTLYKPLEMYPSLENQPDPGIYPATLKLPSRIIKFHLNFPSSMEHHGKVIELSLNLAGNHNNAPTIDALRKAYGLTARHSMDLKDRAGYRILLNESFYEDGMEVFVSVEEHEKEEKGPLAPMLPASAILSDDLYSHINTGNNDTHSHEGLFHSERSKQPQNNADPSTSGSFSLPATSTDSAERLHGQRTGIGRPQQSSDEVGTDLELHFHTEAPDALKIIVEQQDGPPLDSDDNLLELEAYENPPSRYARQQYSIFSPDEMHAKAVALCDFARENDRELPLVKGQVILVSYRYSQGWLVAKDPNSKESGLVPEEYVRLLPSNPIRRTKLLRTNCATCRKRHLKCDEKRPICTNCQKDNRPCEIYDPTAALELARSKNSPPPTLESTTTPGLPDFCTPQQTLAQSFPADTTLFNSGKQQITCNEEGCTKTFGRAAHYRRHKKTAHSSPSPPASPTVSAQHRESQHGPSSAPNSTDDGKTRLYCMVCNKGPYHREDSFRKHESTHAELGLKPAIAGKRSDCPQNSTPFFSTPNGNVGSSSVPDAPFSAYSRDVSGLPWPSYNSTPYFSSLNDNVGSSSVPDAPSLAFAFNEDNLQWPPFDSTPYFSSLDDNVGSSSVPDALVSTGFPVESEMQWFSFDGTPLVDPYRQELRPAEKRDGPRLQFLKTGTHPSEFKSESAMRSVREQAMKQYKADQGDVSADPTRERSV